MDIDQESPLSAPELTGATTPQPAEPALQELPESVPYARFAEVNVAAQQMQNKILLQLSPVSPTVRPLIFAFNYCFSVYSLLCML